MNDIDKQISELIDRKMRNAEILRLRSRGWTLQRIADKYNLTRQRVGKIVGPKKKVAKK